MGLLPRWHSLAGRRRSEGAAKQRAPPKPPHNEPSGLPATTIDSNIVIRAQQPSSLTQTIGVIWTRNGRVLGAWALHSARTGTSVEAYQHLDRDATTSDPAAASAVLVGAVRTDLPHTPPSPTTRAPQVLSLYRSFVRTCRQIPGPNRGAHRLIAPQQNTGCGQLGCFVPLPSPPPPPPPTANPTHQPIPPQQPQTM